MERLRQAIDRGELAPGQPLLSVRELAARIGVHRNTVASAYRRLAEAGLIETGRGRSGSRVARREDDALLSMPRDPELGPDVRNLAFGNPDPALLPDLEPHFVATAAGPPRLYGEEFDLPELTALAREQAAAAGMPAGGVIVCSGAADGIERLLSAHLSPGDRVAVEEPCFTRILLLVRTLGLEPLGVPVDDEGMNPQGLAAALGRGARAVIITPVAQNPTGASLTPERLAALAAVLERHPGVLWIEDDHYGALAQRPPLSLLAEASRLPRSWAVVRSTSKYLGPDLRLALLCADEASAARVRARMAVGARWVSHVLQRAALSALTDPDVAAVVRRAGRVYAERRTALLDALRDAGIVAHGVEGLHVWLPLRHEARLARFLFARGWAVQTGESFQVVRAHGMRITTAALEPAAAWRLAQDIADGLAPHSRSAPA